jgi:hypothetical protein
MTGTDRPLAPRERALVTAMLRDKPDCARFLERLETYRVVDMDDGGMGSVRFVAASSGKKRLFGKRVADAKFVDEDGVPILVAINLDDDGELFELDIWKVDYSPTKKYPALPEP